MQYLCARHRQLVQSNGEQASRLCQGALNHGLRAVSINDWRQASIFLGTAFEIAQIRFAADIQLCQRHLSIAQFAKVGRYYASALCKMEHFEAAEHCLRRVHDGLLYWSGDKRLPYQDRVTAYDQVPEFRDKLIALLNLSGKAAQARCTELLTRQVAQQVGSELCH